MDIERFSAALPKALRFLRYRIALTQVQLAERASITPSMVSLYETGQDRPNLTTLLKLLAALECDFGDLNEAVRVMTDHWTDEAKEGRRPNLQTIHQLAQERGDETGEKRQGRGRGRK